jgi:hypothetical protein
MSAITPVRTFRVMSGDSIPPAVLTWNSRAQRNRLLQVWRCAIFSVFGDQARCVRMAWVLADLFHGDRGYAHASDPYLGTSTCLPLNKVQATLTALDRGGAIVRSHVFQNGRSQRRIYPSSTLLPPDTGGADTPQQPGGQNLKAYTPRIPRTQLALARLQAKRRDEGEGS